MKLTKSMKLIITLLSLHYHHYVILCIQIIANNILSFIVNKINLLHSKLLFPSFTRNLQMSSDKKKKTDVESDTTKESKGLNLCYYVDTLYRYYIILRIPIAIEEQNR